MQTQKLTESKNTNAKIVSKNGPDSKIKQPPLAKTHFSKPRERNHKTQHF
ncbi:hypothetical protein Hanom_Chr14g01299071 [Helianthus anomalus]